MPNRVDGNVSGVRPTLATRPEARQANRAEQATRPNPPEAPAQQADRVEISQQARLQAEQARPRAGAPEANPRGAAVNAPSARPDAGDQGAVNGATEQRAAQLREAQDNAAQEATQAPPERQGNLVDVVG